jgi:uncharacterized membrane protein YdbT with pleckstrin-like domain
MEEKQNVNNVQNPEAAKANAKKTKGSVASNAAKEAKNKIAKQKAAKAPKVDAAPTKKKKSKRKEKPNYVATKSSWYAVNPFLVLTTIILGIWAAAPLIKEDIPRDIWMYGLIAAGALFAIALIVFFGKVIVLKSYKIKYYDNVVVCQFGILNKHERKSAFLGATSVVVDQTLMGRLLNYGDIYIDTIGKWDIDTTYIAKPKKLQAYLEERLITGSMVQTLMGE